MTGVTSRVDENLFMKKHDAAQTHLEGLTCIFVPILTRKYVVENGEVLQIMNPGQQISI